MAVGPSSGAAVALAPVVPAVAQHAPPVGPAPVPDEVRCVDAPPGTALPAYGCVNLGHPGGLTFPDSLVTWRLYRFPTRAAGEAASVAAGVPMVLVATGLDERRALALMLHDARRPQADATACAGRDARPARDGRTPGGVGPGRSDPVRVVGATTRGGIHEPETAAVTTSVHASVSPDGAPVVDPSDCRALVTPTGARSEFPYPIADVVYVDDAPDTPGAVVLVVRLEVPPRGRLNENVFGVGRDGGIAWQITDRGAIGPDSPYTDLVPDGDRVRCGNWSGAELWLAPATGAEVGARRSR